MQTDKLNQKKIVRNYAQSGNGKLPPQALDVEEILLGALMMSKDAIDEVSDILSPQVFYKISNQKVYEAIESLYKSSNPVDIITVTEELRKQGNLEIVGGAYAITLLTERVSAAESVEYYAKVIIQKFMQREMIRISTETISFAYEDTVDVFEMIEDNQRNVFALMGDVNKKDISDMGGLLFDFLEDLEVKPVDGLTGVGSGFNGIDTVTAGWQPGDLHIIAARPAMGKTAFVLRCARNAAIDFKKPTLFFSLEMSELQLTQRLVSAETGIPNDRIRKKNVLDWEFPILHQKLDELGNASLFVDDTPGLNIFEFRAKCRRMKQKYDIQLIIVDYLQLMSDDPKNVKANREQQIGNITRCLKTVAKELNVPVIALSQLSRAVESRPGTNKRPMLSDLRESGNIEQDADLVAFLYRPEYYDIMEGANGESTTGLCEFIIGKNRPGTCPTIKLDFNGAYMKFKDWESKSMVEPEEQALF